MQSKLKGFTLIELMITVAIVGILAAIAYPSYQGSIMKSRRTDATSNLMAFAHILERCYTSYGAYNNSNCSIVNGGTVPATDSQGGYYSISSTALTAATFRLQAVAKTGTTQANDDDCDKLFIDNTGKREADNSGGTDTSEVCWPD